MVAKPVVFKTGANGRRDERERFELSSLVFLMNSLIQDLRIFALLFNSCFLKSNIIGRFIDNGSVGESESESEEETERVCSLSLSHSICFCSLEV